MEARLANADCRAEDLACANFFAADLSGANLARVNLTEANAQAHVKACGGYRVPAGTISTSHLTSAPLTTSQQPGHGAHCEVQASIRIKASPLSGSCTRLR